MKTLIALLIAVSAITADAQVHVVPMRAGMKYDAAKDSMIANLASFAPRLDVKPPSNGMLFDVESGFMHWFGMDGMMFIRVSPDSVIRETMFLAGAKYGGSARFLALVDQLANTGKQAPLHEGDGQSTVAWHEKDFETSLTLMKDGAIIIAQRTDPAYMPVAEKPSKKKKRK